MTDYLQRLVDAPDAERASARPALASRSPVAELDQRLHVDGLADALAGLDAASPAGRGELPPTWIELAA